MILHCLTLHGTKGVRMRSVKGGALGLQTLELTCCTGCYCESDPADMAPQEDSYGINQNSSLWREPDAERLFMGQCCVLLPCTAAFVPSLRGGTSTDDLGSKTLQDFVPVTKTSPKASSCAPSPGLRPSCGAQGHPHQ